MYNFSNLAYNLIFTSYWPRSMDSNPRRKFLTPIMEVVPASSPALRTVKLCRNTRSTARNTAYDSPNLILFLYSSKEYLFLKVLSNTSSPVVVKPVHLLYVYIRQHQTPYSIVIIFNNLFILLLIITL